MEIKKRNGEYTEFNPSKILKRLQAQSNGLKVDFSQICIDVQQLLYDKISAIEIDDLAAKTAASYISVHPDYSKLASNLIVSRLHKEMKINKNAYILRAKELLDHIIIDKMHNWEVNVDYSVDYDFDYLGIISFIHEYGLRKDKVLIELPSEMYFRVALYLADTKEEFQEYYNKLCQKKVSQATPTLANAGTKNSTLISCSTLSLKDDSLEGIDSTIHNMNKHSKNGAGIGLWIGNLRSCESLYASKGKAGGVVKLAQIINSNLRFFKQNENRRGMAALYNDIWHRDIESFINLKNPHGSEETTVKDIFIGVCIPDLFYKRLKLNEKWSLFCPNDILKKFGFNLYNYWGEEFEKRYIEIENSDIPKKVINAKDLMLLIVDIQAKSGVPYIFNRDNANRRYNQSNWGVIKSYQLCIEFAGYHDINNEAQCCLGSIPLHKHVKLSDNGKYEMDYEGLIAAVQTETEILNKIIDKNKWNTEESRITGLQQRNIGIGVAGLADLFAILDLPFESEEAGKINRNIAECLYYGFLSKSNELAKKIEAKVIYPKIAETPLVKDGMFHFKDNEKLFLGVKKWNSLRKDIMLYGVINSLGICWMPTASTSKLLECNECFEVIDKLILNRRTVSGEFVIVNKYMVKDLEAINMWNNEVRESIMQFESLQQLDIPQHLKDKYKTIWEVKQKNLLNMAVDRQVFTDQSQSMNLYWKEADASKMVSALIYGWENGLKTGSYYTKVKRQTNPNKELAIKVIKTPHKPSDSIFECVGCSA